MAKRGGKRRDPSREQFWRRTIRCQERSGLTVSRFCRREGLKDWIFRWWRQELARRDRQTAGTSERREALEPTETVPAAMFLPVRVVDQEAVSSHPSPPIEIVLPAGPTTRVLAGFDRGMLHEVLTVLERRRWVARGVGPGTLVEAAPVLDRGGRSSRAEAVADAGVSRKSGVERVLDQM